MEFRLYPMPSKTRSNRLILPQTVAKFGCAALSLCCDALTASRPPYKVDLY